MTQPVDLERVATLADEMARAAIEGGRAPGVGIAVAHGGEVVFARAWGECDVELGVAATPETRFGLASVTKHVTAAAVMRLVDEGELSLGESIATYLPEYPPIPHQVTVRHLLNHTSGIRSLTAVDQRTFTDREARLDLSFAELLTYFAHHPFDFVPGRRFRYNNSGYYLLGEIVARAAGTPFTEYVERELLRPLGLAGMVFGDPRRVVPHRTKVYEWEEGRIVNARFWNLARSTPSTGGLFATPSELVRWSHVLHTGKVVSDESLRAMTTATTLDDGTRVPYGFGLTTGELAGLRRLSHGGGRPGVAAFLAHYPERAVAVAVMSNASRVRPTVQRMERVVAAAALGLELPDDSVAEIPISADAASRYAGTFAVQLPGRTIELRTFLDEGVLTAQPGGQSTFRLSYQGEDEFVVTDKPEIRLAFVMEDDRAAGVTLHQHGRTFEGERTG